MDGVISSSSSSSSSSSRGSIASGMRCVWTFVDDSLSDEKRSSSTKFNFSLPRWPATPPRPPLTASCSSLPYQKHLHVQVSAMDES